MSLPRFWLEEEEEEKKNFIYLLMKSLYILMLKCSSVLFYFKEFVTYSLNYYLFFYKKWGILGGGTIPGELRFNLSKKPKKSYT